MGDARDDDCSVQAAFMQYLTLARDRVISVTVERDRCMEYAPATMRLEFEELLKRDVLHVLVDVCGHAVKTEASRVKEHVAEDDAAASAETLEQNLTQAGRTNERLQESVESSQREARHLRGQLSTLQGQLARRDEQLTQQRTEFLRYIIQKDITRSTTHTRHGAGRQQQPADTKDLADLFPSWDQDKDDPLTADDPTALAGASVAGAPPGSDASASAPVERKLQLLQEKHERERQAQELRRREETDQLRRVIQQTDAAYRALADRMGEKAEHRLSLLEDEDGEEGTRHKPPPVPISVPWSGVDAHVQTDDTDADISLPSVQDEAEHSFLSHQLDDDSEKDADDANEASDEDEGTDEEQGTKDGADDGTDTDGGPSDAEEEAEEDKQADDAEPEEAAEDASADGEKSASQQDDDTTNDAPSQPTPSESGGSKTVSPVQSQSQSQSQYHSPHSSAPPPAHPAEDTPAPAAEPSPTTTPRRPVFAASDSGGTEGDSSQADDTRSSTLSSFEGKRALKGGKRGGGVSLYPSKAIADTQHKKTEATLRANLKSTEARHKRELFKLQEEVRIKEQVLDQVLRDVDILRSGQDSFEPELVGRLTQYKTMKDQYCSGGGGGGGGEVENEKSMSESQQGTGVSSRKPPPEPKPQSDGKFSASTQVILDLRKELSAKSKLLREKEVEVELLTSNMQSLHGDLGTRVSSVNLAVVDKLRAAVHGAEVAEELYRVSGWALLAMGARYSAILNASIEGLKKDRHEVQTPAMLRKMQRAVELLEHRYAVYMASQRQERQRLKDMSNRNWDRVLFYARSLVQKKDGPSTVDVQSMHRGLPGVNQAYTTNTRPASAPARQAAPEREMAPKASIFCGKIDDPDDVALGDAKKPSPPSPASRPQQRPSSATQSKKIVSYKEGETPLQRRNRILSMLYRDRRQQIEQKVKERQRHAQTSIEPAFGDAAKVFRLVGQRDYEVKW